MLSLVRLSEFLRTTFLIGLKNVCCLICLTPWMNNIFVLYSCIHGYCGSCWFAPWFTDKHICIFLTWRPIYLVLDLWGFNSHQPPRLYLTPSGLDKVLTQYWLKRYGDLMRFFEMEVLLWLNYGGPKMLLKVDCLPNVVGKQLSIPLINLGRKWTLSRMMTPSGFTTNQALYLVLFTISAPLTCQPQTKVLLNSSGSRGLQVRSPLFFHSSWKMRMVKKRRETGEREEENDWQ